MAIAHLLPKSVSLLSCFAIASLYLTLYVPGCRAPDALIEHLNSVHTKIGEVGGVAEDYGVKTLVLNHIVPGNTPVGHLIRAKRDFPGELVIGEDLMEVGIGKAGKDSPRIESLSFGSVEGWMRRAQKDIFFSPEKR